MIPDEELYRRWLSGDEEGLRALMERYGDRLTLYLDGYVRDLHEGEDLMIEAFAWIIAKRPAIRAGGFRAYLFQAGRRMALRQAKKRRSRPCFSLEELAESAERARILRRCMEELHGPYREALFLVYFEGLSHREAAAVLKKSEKQVAELIYRGKNALRKRLEEEGI